MNMASKKDAMTPAAAAAAIADVQDYRQGMTARAAGTVWMVWALAMAAFALMDVIAAPGANMHEQPSDGWQTADGGGWLAIVMIGILAGGVIVSNAIWKSHAIVRDQEHKAWVAWVTALGIALAFALFAIGLVYLSIYLWIQEWDGATLEPGETITDITYMFLTPILSGAVALALTVLQRRRVSMLPGFVAVGAMVLVQILVPIVTSGTVEDKVAQAGVFHTLAVLVTFMSVGSYIFNRG